MKKYMLLVCAVALPFLVSSCTQKKTVIKIAGSTTVLPVVSKAAEKFRKLHNLTIIVNGGGSGVGINQLGEGNVDIGMASRDITEAEYRRYPKVNMITHTIGRDAVVPVISSEIYDAGVHALTLAQIGQIYLGKITNWKQVGGPDKEILVIDKEGSRGTRHVFMKAVLGNEEAKAPGADLVLGANNEEQTAIVQSDAAIGMLSNAWMNKDVKGLSIITADKQVVAPTLANIRNGSFPITRNLYVITNGKPKGDVRAFINYILSEPGQRIVRESGYIGIGK